MSEIDNELEQEDEAVKNVLNFRTARYLVLFLLVILIVGFVISFLDYKKAADKGQHVTYFWVELNIPKGYPDTVYQDKIIYVDSSAMIRDSASIPATDGAVVQPAQAPVPVPVAARSAQVIQPATTKTTLPKESLKPKRQSSASADNTPQMTEGPHHLTDDDKMAILSKIDGFKRAGYIQSDEIEIGHIHNSNSGDFIPELVAFLKSKGYKPDDGSTIIDGHPNRKGWWAAVKMDKHKVAIGVGLF